MTPSGCQANVKPVARLKDDPNCPIDTLRTGGLNEILQEPLVHKVQGSRPHAHKTHSHLAQLAMKCQL